MWWIEGKRIFDIKIPRLQFIHIKMSVKLYNSFEVKEQDFKDISCFECKKNGQYLDCLLLCADCANFMCNKCMFYHLKNSDENHNTTVEKTSTRQAGMYTPPTALNEGANRSADTKVDNDLKQKQQEAEKELHALQDQLQELHNSKYEKLAMVQHIGDTAHERIEEIKKQVMTDLTEMEEEITEKVKLEVQKYSDNMNKEIKETAERIAKVSALLGDLKNQNSSPKYTNGSTLNSVKHLEDMLDEIKKISDAWTCSNEDSNVKGGELLNVVSKQPIEYFCYKINKLCAAFNDEGRSETCVLEDRGGPIGDRSKFTADDEKCPSDNVNCRCPENSFADTI